MKAMMSDKAGEGLQRHSWVTIPNWDLAAQAEREARRILAATEDGLAMPYALRVWEPHTPLASALAEALRAFVVSR